MKMVLLSIFCSALLIIMSFFSCEGKEVQTTAQGQAVEEQFPATFDPNKDVIATLEEGELVLAIKQDILELAIRKANYKIRGISSYEFRIDANGGEEYGNAEVAFLMVYVELRDGGQQLMAFDLKTNKDKKLYYINMETSANACAGFCCSQCQWSIPAGGTLYQCGCVNPVTTTDCGEGAEAGCNHRLTTSKAEVIQPVE